MAMSTFHKVTLVSCLFLSLSLLLPKMLLSRGKRDLGPEVGPGQLPPMMQRQNKAEGQAHLGPGQPYSKAHSPEAYVKVKTRPVGAGGGGKTSLMGQILPIYGFGILLYILYILFKITSKGKNRTALYRCPVVNSGNLGKNMPEYELGKLQEKLKETEEALEQIVSKAGRNSKRVKNIPLPQEERLLQQLKEVTRMMQESRLVGALSPEMEAEQTHYAEGWEGYPEETYPRYEGSCRSQHDGAIFMEELGNWLPTAEEQAERMEMEEDEQQEEEASINRREGMEDDQNRIDSEGEEEEDLDGVDEGDEDEGLDGEDDKEGGEDEDSDGVHQGEMEGKEREEHLCLLAGARSPMREREVGEVPLRAAQGRKEGKQISFSDIKMVFCYSVESSDSNNNVQETKEDEEDEEDDVEEDDDEEDDEKDPIIMAENLRFNCKASNEVEDEEDEQEFLHTTDSEAEGSASETERAEALGFGILRKRSRREPA